jgi:uncharacterized protein YijF (DUF1287 family)
MLVDTDDREFLALLMLPVVLVAGLIAMGQTVRVPSGIVLPELPSGLRISRPAVPPAAQPTIAVAPPMIAAAPPIRALRLPDRSPLAPAIPYPNGQPRLAYAPVAPVPTAPLDVGRPPQTLALRPPAALGPLASAAPQPQPAIAAIPPSALESVCRPAASPAAVVSSEPFNRLSSEDFGRKLAAVAAEQLGQFTVYSARYRRLSFPGGDVPSFYGACSDVIIRAYRRLGIDLQSEVYAARLGGDTSIAHRRTETLRTLFQRGGASLPVTDFPEDYKPGDVVTYYRPFSRVSRAHIAIVSDVMGPNRRPMIIHNRGYGPQLEDALFVDRITGHYRYRGRPAETRTAVAASRLTPVAATRLAARTRPTF